MNNINLQNLPNAVEIEINIIGSILFSPELIYQIESILHPGMFYNFKTREIYTSIQHIVNNNEQLDIFTISNNLKIRGKLELIGGYSYLNELMSTDSNGWNIVEHSRILVQKYIQRELIDMSMGVIEKSKKDVDDVFQLLDNVNSEFVSIQNTVSGDKIKSVSEVKQSLLKKVISVKAGMILSDEIPTCVNFIKMYRNTVTVIGAKPGTGKTAFMLSSAAKQSKSGYKILILSLEMTSERLTARIIQSSTSIFAKRLISGDITDIEYDNINDLELDDKILIDEGIGVNSQNMKVRMVALYKKYKFDVLYIDYFQKIPLIGRDNVVNLQFNLMENQICAFAKEYPVSVCILSQLTRGESSGLESLRGGGIEQGAQQVYLFLDEHVKDNRDLEFNEIPPDRRGKITVTCEKNRDDSYMGGTIYFDKLRQTMMEWSLKPITDYSTTLSYNKDIF